MPFKKVGTDKYKGPSGKTFNLNQVKLYYAHGGRFPGEKENNVSGKQESRKKKK